MNELPFDQYYSNKLELFESYLKENFPRIPQQASILEESMQYSLFAGGKRIRSILLLTTVECSKRDSSFALPFACALEYIHTYSLIHDDLPCMDDDDLRRGIPANHIKFGEDVALLAGDALLTHCFCLISTPNLSKKISPKILLQIINILAEKAGTFGMVAGQIADIRNPGHSSPEDTLKFVHANKTGALITASIQIGALLAQVGIDSYRALTCFGEEIGKCFQVKDDILDETGKKEILGKNPGSDQKNKTLNYPDVFGLSKSHQLANEFYEKATGFLDQSGLDTTRLRQLADFVLKREH